MAPEAPFHLITVSRSSLATVSVLTGAQAILALTGFNEDSNRNSASRWCSRFQNRLVEMSRPIMSDPIGPMCCLAVMISI